MTKCDSCEMLAINGMACHETRCPDSWKHTKRECKWCGQEFVPDEREQQACDDDCRAIYFGEYC